MTKKLNDWRMARKVIVAFGAIAAMLVAVAALGISEAGKLRFIGERHVTRGIGGAMSLSAVIVDIKEERLATWTYFTSPTAADAATTADRQRRTRAALLRDIEEYSKIAGEDFQPKVAELRRAIEELHATTDRIFARQDFGSPQLLQLVRGEGRQRAERALDVAEELQRMSLARSQKANEDGAATARLGLIMTLALAGLALGGLFLIGRLLVASVARPMSELASVTGLLAQGRESEVPHRDRKDEIGELAQAVVGVRQLGIDRAAADAKAAAAQRSVTDNVSASLQRLGEGDLTARIDAEFPGDYRALKDNFNSTVEKLGHVIASVAESAGQIRTGSSEIAQASEDLARRTEANAASLEETSAAIVQMDSRLKAAASAATRTVGRADQAIATVSSGRSLADQAVEAMGRVSESAKGIDSVIEGLDKIAFQTRVLAMNAAVEAGRAGEAGRGFAVVADLVSALAMRAEEEAKRARDQLTVTQSDIGSAVEAVGEVDGALQTIAGDVGEVHQLLGSMASDNQAQALAIDEINAAVAAMDQSTQQNAAMVEETSAAARNLLSEVTSMSEQAARFRTGAAPAAPAAAPAAPRKGTEGAYRSPVKPLPPAAVSALTRAVASDDDWKEF